ncbi:MAG TPA: response regulator [Devosia sp.]|nr:response regulator [Devosia sp.]
MIVPAKLCGLVVEDNEYSRSLAVESLNRLGIGTILEASDGTEGLAILQKQPVDFVVLDWYMPEISGAGFIRLVRGGQANCRADLPIIISTAYATRENISRMRELGLKEVLIKPFDVKQLSASISSALSNISVEISVAEPENSSDHTEDDEDNRTQVLL